MPKRNVNINVERVEDLVMREILTEIKEELERETLSDWVGVHKEKTVSGSGTFDIWHDLGFIPKDVWVTYKSPDAVTVTVEYDQSTTSQVFVTTTGAVTFRLFIGSYSED